MKTFKRRLRRASIVLTMFHAIHLATYGQSAEDLRSRARKYEPLMVEAATKYGIDPRLLWTIAYLESRFQPSLISPKGARGMMQFMPGTASRYNLINPHDAPQSINAAARYLKNLSVKFDNRLDLVLAAYNAGEGAVESYRKGVTLVLGTGKTINPTGLMTGGVPPYRETRNYVTNGVQIFSAIGGKLSVDIPKIAVNTDAFKDDDEAEELDEIREDSLYAGEPLHERRAENRMNNRVLTNKKSQPDSIFIE